MRIASEKGFETIVGEYIPTPKNDMVKDHYKNLGFTEKEQQWEMDVKSFTTLPTKIDYKS
jgi:predicted enzyme involved in methoxymalonyl-ACP biosynthesis